MRRGGVWEPEEAGGAVLVAVLEEEGHDVAGGGVPQDGREGFQPQTCGRGEGAHSGVGQTEQTKPLYSLHMRTGTCMLYLCEDKNIVPRKECQ